MGLKNELIDENLFVEALTLCALDTNDDKELNAALDNFDPRLHEEPSKATLKLCLRKAL